MDSAVTITVGFTDLVGSTEMWERLGPTTANTVRRTHFALLRDALAAAGGTEVKSLGDGLMVTFPTARSALDSAVAMQQSIDAHNRRGGEMLRVRIGLSCGDVIHDDGDYFGEPVIEAARLCALAEPGQILITQTLHLLGNRTGHSFEPLGHITLKGLSEPVPVVALGWNPVEETLTFPLPFRLLEAPGSVFVGRRTEAQVITQAFKDASGDSGRRVVLLAGEPGLGKTTLAGHVARRLNADGAVVLFGGCDEDLKAPYGPFVEALRHLVEHAPADVLDTHVATFGGELTRITPALRDRVPGCPPPQSSDADTERFMLYGAVADLLRQVGRVAPVVLLIDDLHWLDTPSMGLLRHIVGVSDPMRLLVLGTFRDHEIGHSHPFAQLLAVWHRLTGIERLHLSGFADIEVLEFMERIAEHEMDETGVSLAHALTRETGGNPFFVTELLRHLAETGLIYQETESGRWVAAADLETAGLPTSLREVIGVRVARLGPDATSVLQAAAVIGQEFDLDLLASATGLTDEQVLDVLDRASGAALAHAVADTPGRYRFDHALIQHTLYNELAPPRRGGAHRRVAEALEQLCDGVPGDRVGELAHHWFVATQPIDLERVVDYSEQAGALALQALAPDDACRYFLQAIQVNEQLRQPDEARDTKLHVQLGIAQRQTGDPAFRDTLLEAARRGVAAGRDDVVVAAALANNRGYFTSIGEIDAEKVEILEQALATTQGHRTRDRALLCATLCNELGFVGSFEQRCNLADEARAIATELGEHRLLVEVYNLLELPLDIPATLAQRTEMTSAARAMALQLGEPHLLFWSGNWRSITAGQSADMAEVDRCLTANAELAERTGMPMLRWNSLYHGARRAMLSGDVELAEGLASEAYTVGADSGQPDAFTFFGAQLIAIRRFQGRLPEMLDLVAAAAADNPNVSGFTAVHCVALHDCGRQEEAAALLDRFVRGDAAVPFDTAWSVAMTMYAHVAVGLAHADGAARLYETLAPFEDQLADNGLIFDGPIAVHLAGLARVLGRFDDAERHLDRASVVSEAAGARFYQLSGRLERARLLLARGSAEEVAEAMAIARRVAQAAEPAGYGSLVSAAEAVLASA